MNKLSAFLCLTILCLVVQATNVHPRYKATKVNKHALVIDGSLEEPCWTQAQWQTNFHPFNKKVKLNNKTRFKVICDNEKLYFAIECFETSLGKMKVKAKDKDDPVYSDDCVEIFIAPEEHLSSDANVVEYYQFAINSVGVRFDSFYKAGIGEKKWNAQWKAAVKKTKKSWILEIAIPFYNFDISESTDKTWRLNITRKRVADAAQAKLSSWAMLEHSFHQPRKFGYLHGLNIDFRDYLLRLSPPETTTILQSNKTIPAIKLQINNNTAKAQKLRLELQLLNGDDISIKRKSCKLVLGGAIEETIGLPDIKKSGKYKCNIVLSEGCRIIKFKEYTVDFDILPIKISMVNPRYRKTIFPSQRLKNIVLDVEFMEPPAKLQKYSINFYLKNNKTNKLLYQKTVSRPEKKFQIKFNAHKLPLGNYVIEIVLLSNGKKVCELMENLRKVGSSPGNEVRIGNDLNLIFNGKKIFPHGFLATNSASGIKSKGFNCGHSYVMNYFGESKAQRILDEALSEKLPMIFYPYFKFKFTFFGFRDGKKITSDISEGQLATMIKRVKNLSSHKGVLGWYLCDEPRGAKFHKTLEKVYDVLRREDPYHPVFALDNRASGCIALSNSADVLMIDYYPDFKRNGQSFKPIVSIYNSIQAVRRATNDKVPVWFVPQAFNRSKFRKNPEELPYRAPTYFESRCMDYIALVAGAKGIMYYLLTSKPGILQNAEMKTGIIDGLGAELWDISPVLLQESIEGAKSSVSGVYLMLKHYKGNYFLFAVNPSYKSIKDVELTIKKLKHSKMKVLFEDRIVGVIGNRFKDDFTPLGVHIYTTNTNFKETFKLKDIIDKIRKSASLQKSVPHDNN